MEKTIELPKPLYEVGVRDVGDGLQAAITRQVFLPVTSLSIFNDILTVKDVHAFDTGEYQEWTRYYMEQQGCQVDVLSGISFHLENNGIQYDLCEYLNQRDRRTLSAEIWLDPIRDSGEAFDETMFYDTLGKVLTAIYKGNDVEVPDLSRLVE